MGGITMPVAEQDQEADGEHRARAKQRHDQAEGTPHSLRIGRYELDLNS